MKIKGPRQVWYSKKTIDEVGLEMNSYRFFGMQIPDWIIPPRNAKE